jgi:putative endonuclease
MYKQYYIYILSNDSNTVLYTGVTNDLKRRVYVHKEKLADGFTKKYNINKLVYYEVCESIISAISREKQIKGLLRHKKHELIANQNPSWNDLYGEI